MASQCTSLIGKTNNTLVFKFGIGNGTAPATTASGPSRVKGRQSFNDQYYLSGGVDFTVTENPAEGNKLSTSWDWQQMLDEVSCLMKDSMSAAGHWFQVFDNNLRGTIVGGAVAPFSGTDHWSAISAMVNEPVPIGETGYCEVI
jgi:hypothetical protein